MRYNIKSVEILFENFHLNGIYMWGDLSPRGTSKISPGKISYTHLRSQKFRNMVISLGLAKFTSNFRYFKASTPSSNFLH